jgi:hypothetical protein
MLAFWYAHDHNAIPVMYMMESEPLRANTTELSATLDDLVETLPPREDIADVQVLTDRLAKQEARAAERRDTPAMRRINKLGKLFAHVPELYGYEPRQAFYADIQRLHTLTTEIEQPGVQLDVDTSYWNKLGVRSAEGLKAFEDAYCTTRYFGQAELNDGLNPYESWMKDHDPGNLQALDGSLLQLERHGYKVTLTEMQTPELVKGAVMRIARSHYGFTHFLRPYITDGFKPVITDEDRADTQKEYQDSLEALGKKYDTESALYKAAKQGLDKERDLTLDLSSSLNPIDAMTELGVRLDVEGDILPQHVALLETARDALTNVRKQYAVTQILEDYYRDAISKPMNILLSSAIGTGVLTGLQFVPGMPDWFLQASAGYSDDIVSLGALLLAAGGISKGELAAQVAVAGVGLVGLGDLSRYIDSLANSGSELKQLAAGAIFATTALGVATAGSTLLGAQNSMKFKKLAADYKLQDYMPSTEELDTALASCESFDEARALIEGNEMNRTLNQSQRHSITQRLQHIDPSNWREELKTLTTPASNWADFRQAIGQNPLQGFLYEASAIMFVIDTATTGHMAHLIPALAVMGSLEGGVAWAIYMSTRGHLLKRLQRQAVTATMQAPQ